VKSVPVRPCPTEPFSDPDLRVGMEMACNECDTPMEETAFVEKVTGVPNTDLSEISRHQPEVA